MLSGTISFREEERGLKKANLEYERCQQRYSCSARGLFSFFCFFVFLQLVTASDRYIQHFEYKEGKVLLYFGEVIKPNNIPIPVISLPIPATLCHKII